MKLNELIEQSESMSPDVLIKEAYGIFQPHIIATSSFGTNSGVLIDLIAKTELPIKIVYINTGFLFKETLTYIESLKNYYKKLYFIEISPFQPKEEFLKEYGLDIIKENPDLCCRLRKIEPLANFFKEKKIKAWLTGIRKDQTKYRQKLHKIELTQTGIYKINPILEWTSKDVYYYMIKNNIPFHPLYEKGYTSIGCEPCTDLPDLLDERSGRWKGKTKKECGLHTNL